MNMQMSYKFRIYEGGKMVDLESYSGQEIESLEEAILKLLNPLPTDDDIVIDFTEGTINIRETKWLGKQHQIYPRQFGLTPWSKKITVRFIP